MSYNHLGHVLVILTDTVYVSILHFLGAVWAGSHTYHRSDQVLSEALLFSY